MFDFCIPIICSTLNNRNFEENKQSRLVLVSSIACFDDDYQRKVYMADVERQSRLKKCPFACKTKIVIFPFERTMFCNRSSHGVN